MFEPQWNPSVESQAIARAIRLGQKQQVLVTRYYVKDSIEQVSNSSHVSPDVRTMVISRIMPTSSIGHVLPANDEVEDCEDGFQKGPAISPA